MKKIPFWKMSGAGNDFIVIDNRQGAFPRNVPPWARRLCDRHEGIGADGLLLLERSKKAHFRMVYFNSDGSRASMCGNGARCIAWFAHKRNGVGPAFSLETDSGLVQVLVRDHQVRISLRDIGDFQPRLAARANGRTYALTFIDTGVPHAVCFVPRVEKVDVASVGRALRHHPAFAPAGANIDFVERVDRHTVKVRTFERGVEAETLACGTGVTASAIAAGLQGLVIPPIRCRTQGGDTLEVRFQMHPENSKRLATQVTLRGPVRLTFQGEVYV